MLPFVDHTFEQEFGVFYAKVPSTRTIPLIFITEVLHCTVMSMSIAYVRENHCFPCLVTMLEKLKGNDIVPKILYMTNGVSKENLQLQALHTAFHVLDNHCSITL